jgi:hypothetical protein
MHPGEVIGMLSDKATAPVISLENFDLTEYAENLLVDKTSFDISLEKEPLITNSLFSTQKYVNTVKVMFLILYQNY